MVRHASFVALAVIVLIELLALTVTFTPYIRPYEPGHAKLKTRWPLYLIGAYAFSYRLVALERLCWTDSRWFVGLLICLAALAIALDVAGRTRAGPSSTDGFEELANEEGQMAVLGSLLSRPAWVRQADRRFGGKRVNPSTTRTGAQHRVGDRTRAGTDRHPKGRDAMSDLQLTIEDQCAFVSSR
jgi:hypothetical protein